MILSRRGFLSGLGAALAAPAIVKVASLMPIKAPPLIEVRTWTHKEYGLGFKVTEEELGDDLSETVIERLVANHPNYILWPGVKKWFGDVYENAPSQYKHLFKESA